MAILDAKNKLVAWCNSQLGKHEGANNWNDYAAMPEIRQLLGWDAQNQPWCDIFTDAAFVSCFGLAKGAAMTYQPIGKGSAACAVSAQYFKAAGAWYDKPSVGDVIFFYSGGGINHQGIVTVVGMGTITTIEGNSSDRVARRTYATDTPQIAGYGRPRWELTETDSPEPETLTEPEGAAQAQQTDQDALKKYCVINLRVLSYGDGLDDPDEAVRAVQLLLIGRGYRCGYAGPDGEYGTQTKKAVEAFQRGYNLAADGVIGAETWAALLGVAASQN